MKYNFPTFETWVNSVVIENIEVNRNTNRAVYALPIVGLSLIENEHLPYWGDSSFWVWLNGLNLEDTEENRNLLKKYNGILREEFYSEDMYFCQFDSLENAYQFLVDNYENIINSFINQN